MANLQDIMKLAEADGGKFFVMDESGDVKLVIMGVEDYQRVLLRKLQKQIQDVEQINREIVEAQLTDAEPAAAPAELSVPKPRFQSPKVENGTTRKFADLREEVIDPSFDFEGPKNTDDI